MENHNEEVAAMLDRKRNKAKRKGPGKPRETAKPYDKIRRQKSP